MSAKFTAINHSKYEKSSLWIWFMLASEVRQITAHDCNVVHVHKGFVAA